MTKKILLTGANGFVGGHILNRLIKNNFDVLAVSRSYNVSDGFKPLDLTDKNSVSKFVESYGPFDTVVHCAALAHGEYPPNNESVSVFNSRMVYNLVSAFGKVQPSWIFMSSVSVYGETLDEKPISINLIPTPVENYGKGKLHDELLLTKVCNRLDILRLAPVYDAIHLADVKKRVFIPKTNIKIKICPAPYYTFCNVEVVGNKVLECLEKEQGRKIYQLGDSEPVSQHDIARKFSGRSLVVPKFLFKIIVKILSLKITAFEIPKLLVIKLGFNNIYKISEKTIQK